MKIVTAEEFRREFCEVYGREPSPDLVRFALAYNDMLNSDEEGRTV